MSTDGPIISQFGGPLIIEREKNGGKEDGEKT